MGPWSKHSCNLLWLGNKFPGRDGAPHPKSSMESRKVGVLVGGHWEHEAAGFTSLPTTRTDDLGFVLVPSEDSLLSQLYPNC